ncbi:hypothetical protein F4677DRAFT_434419 [Hypoxylon crocopeplum]|nr:hypothetical protein F4677DRAFT_434419 [Hypoxylon crocopeplum]
MKLLSGASLIGLLAASLANAQGSRKRGHPPFSVTKFSAGATPHSSIGYIELSWSYSGGLNQTRCSASPGTYQVFPSIVQTSCSDPSTSFNLTKRADGGADLVLWHETAPAAFAHAMHTITTDEIVWTNQQSPTGTVQVYAGPQNFTVKAVYPDM